MASQIHQFVLLFTSNKLFCRLITAVCVICLLAGFSVHSIVENTATTDVIKTFELSWAGDLQPGGKPEFEPESEPESEHLDVDSGSPDATAIYGCLFSLARAMITDLSGLQYGNLVNGKLSLTSVIVRAPPVYYQ